MRNIKKANHKYLYFLLSFLVVGHQLVAPAFAQSLPLSGFMTNGAKPSPRLLQQVNQLSPNQQNYLLKKYNAPTEPAAISPDINPYTNYPQSQPFATIKDPSSWIDSRTNLKRFGYDVFQQTQNSDFSKGSIPVNPSDYQLGSGDVITIRVWGKLEDTFDVPIQRNGRAFIPKAGFVGLAGLTVDQAAQVIKKELDRLYVNIQIQVSLTQLRPVTVFVLGEVERPGAIDLSGLNTAFSALYAAGGPRTSGSLRKIVLKRGGRTVRVIDFYQYLLRGELGQSLRLEPGDTLFVPSAGDSVGVAGNVKRPGLFEIQGPTSLYEAIINYSAGFSADSYRKRIQINRVENGERKVLLDVTFGSDAEFKSRAKRILLRGGDVVNAIPILELEHNTVSIQGHVFRPGKFQFHKGQTVTDLIALAEGLKPRVYPDRIEIKRFISETQKESLVLKLSDAPTFILKEWDDVKIFSEATVKEENSIQLGGNIANQGTLALSEGMRLLDVFFANPTAINTALPLTRIELIRLQDTQQLHIETAIQDLVQNPSSSLNVLLEPRDIVSLRVAPQNKLQRVEISGQVNYPGIYWVEPHLRLSELIKRAGNLTDRAFINGIQYYRQSVKDRGIDQYNKILEEEKRRLSFDIGGPTLNQLSLPTPTTNSALIFLEDIINKNQGRMFLNINSISELENSKNNIEIEAFDRIIIPSDPVEIQLVGGVMQRSAITFQSGANTGYYIEHAGGFTEFADTSSIYAMKANGYVIKNPTVVEKGDIIYIPERPKQRFDLLDALLKISQVLFNFAGVYRVFLL